MELIRSVVPVALTSLVGRDALVGEARRLLETASLVTLVGPGGVGKTRVAWDLARRAGDEYDAVAVADLLELGEAETVERELASALGIVRPAPRQERELLAESLAGRRVLLVLDNCEHLREAAGDVATALCRELPGLRVLATSRRPLEVSGEYVLRVPPLPVPRQGCAREEADVPDALVLLGERAAAAGGSITDLDDEDWDALIQLVRWSGGLPLVLELIAARLGSGLSPATIAQRLDGGQLLTSTGRRMPPHHQALWQVLDWSYQLCSPAEQHLWARLSVFSGGFDLAMAEEVCADPGGTVARSAVLDLLTGLVQQSIVVTRPGGRFCQLPPVHAHGLHRLQALGEREATRERHAALIGRLVAEAARQRFCPGELEALRRVHRDLPNIRAALAYCTVPERAEAGLRIAADINLLGFSFLAAFPDEFGAWLERMLALTAPEPSPGRVTAVATLALVRLWQGDTARADVHRRECLELSRGLPAARDDLPIVTFLDGMHLFLAEGDPRCVGLLARAGDAFGEQDARDGMFQARAWCAFAAGFLADRETARWAAAECLAFAEVCGGSWAMSWALFAQGCAERADPGTAIPLLRRALRMMNDMGDQAWSTALCVEAIAWVWAAHGQPLHAARLLGAAAAVQRNTGAVDGGPGPFRRERERAITRLRAALGDKSYTTVFRQGTGLSIDEACSLALSSPAVGPGTPDQAPLPPMGALTARQQDIALLVAQGLSNAQISQKLHISQRTVENHLGQVFTRIGARNRAQVAAWVSAHRAEGF